LPLHIITKKTLKLCCRCGVACKGLFLVELGDW